MPCGFQSSFLDCDRGLRVEAAKPIAGILRMLRPIQKHTPANPNIRSPFRQRMPPQRRAISSSPRQLRGWRRTSGRTGCLLAKWPNRIFAAIETSVNPLAASRPAASMSFGRCLARALVPCCSHSIRGDFRPFSRGFANHNALDSGWLVSAGILRGSSGTVQHCDEEVATGVWLSNWFSAIQML